MPVGLGTAHHGQRTRLNELSAFLSINKPISFVRGDRGLHGRLPSLCFSLSLSLLSLSLCLSYLSLSLSLCLCLIRSFSLLSYLFFSSSLSLSPSISLSPSLSLPPSLPLSLSLSLSVFMSISLSVTQCVHYREQGSLAKLVENDVMC